MLYSVCAIGLERLLWDEKTEAGARREAWRLESLLALVLELADDPRVKRRAFERLADSVRAELGAVQTRSDTPRGGEQPAPQAGQPLDLAARIAAAERRLDALRAEITELRRLTGAPAAHGASEPSPVRPEPQRTPVRPPERDRSVAPPPRDRVPAWARNVSLGDLLGARALAWAGGVVTLLGVVFLFVLAVDRGWIGPEARVGIGALASVLVFVAGIEVNRRFGRLYSGLGAVGAGIAGAFATLLAANALYGFVGDQAALAVAGFIAACATAVALLWAEELVAGLGLVGAMLVPLLVPIQEGRFSVVGTAFVALVFAGTAVTAVYARWPVLVGVGGVVSVVQIAGLVAQSEDGRAGVLVLAGAFTAVYIGTGIACWLRGGRLDALAAPILVAAAMLGGAATVHLVGGPDGGGRPEGAVLAALALAYGALAAVFFRSKRDRDLSAILWAIGLAVLAVAAVDLVSGIALGIAWAAEAALLGWLAARLREPRFVLAGLAYLLFATGYVLGYEAPPSRLFVDVTHPADGVLAVAALAVGGGLFAWFARMSPAAEPGGPLATAIAVVLARVRAAVPALFWAAGVVAAYAAALGILEVAGLEHGHVVLTGFLSSLALALVATGIVRDARSLTIGGAIWLAVVVGEVLVFDVPELSHPLGWYSLLVAGIAALASGFVLARFSEFGLAGGGYVAASAGLLTTAVVALLDGTRAGVDLEGTGLLGLATVYAVLAAAVFRAPSQRDHATLEWSLALALAAAASAELLDGTWLTVVWAGAAGALVWLRLRTREPRLGGAAAAYLALALGHALTIDGPPTDLLVATRHPGAGVPALLATIAAAALVIRWATPERIRGFSVRPAGWAAFGALTLYTVSLSVLELVEDASTASIATDFQRGHTATSGVWGLVGLAVLYLGLTRHSRRAQLGGFALFGASVSKLFLYDLPSLSSVQRALSFLAVGALLLVGAFFYQRLNERQVAR